MAETIGGFWSSPPPHLLGQSGGKHADFPISPAKNFSMSQSETMIFAELQLS
mgnify:CR=1 FL=1